MDKTLHSTNIKFYSVLAVAVVALIVGTFGLIIGLNRSAIPAASSGQPTTIQGVGGGSYERAETPTMQKNGVTDYKTEYKTN